jgi:hypothetical protein
VSPGEPRNSQILSGFFNIDFSTEESKPFIDFFKTALNLNMSNGPKESTYNKIWNDNRRSVIISVRKIYKT